MKGVSFVICCHNSVDVIEGSILGVINQYTEFPFELILVDNNCSDSTVEIANMIVRQHDFVEQFKVVAENDPGLVYARIAGVREARFDYIVFVDDDNVIADNWVDIVVSVFDVHTDVGVIGSHNTAFFPKNVIEPKWFDMVKASYACAPQSQMTGDITCDRRYVFGAGMCVRKNVILPIFDSGVALFLQGRTDEILLSGDDSEICMRAVINGWRLWYQEDLKLDHVMRKKRMKWQYFKEMNQGHFASQIILDIYNHVIDGKRIPSRFEIATELLARWFWVFVRYRKRDFFCEGTWASVVLSSVIGRTKGFIYYFFCYRNIKNEICGLRK